MQKYNHNSEIIITFQFLKRNLFGNVFRRDKVKFGYVRPLYNDKDCSIQLEKLNKASNCDYIFKELHGEPKKRMELEKLLMSLQPNDVILVERMFVLADTTRHLMELLKLCKRDGVTIEFLDEGLNSRDLISFSLQDMIQKMIHFQTDIIKQSTIIGMEQAKDEGKAIGRPRKSDENIKKAISMYQSGTYTLHDIKQETGISKSTLYRYLENADLK